MKLKLLILMILFISPQIVFVQSNPPQNEVEKLKKEFEELKDKYDKKIEEINNLILEIKKKIEKKEKENELEKLLEEAEKLSKQEEKETIPIDRKFHSGARQLQAMNPNISVSGDFYGVMGKSKNEYNTIPSNFSVGSNKFFMRELEVALVAPLDPFTRGKSFISIEPEGISLEEGYMQWLNLPANLNLKIGIFHSQFGVLNRWHPHAMPQFDRPRVLVNFFGRNQLGGLGISGNFLLPKITAHANEFNLEIITGGNGLSFTNEGDRNLVYITHFKNYYDLTRNTYFELGISGAAGKNDAAEKYTSYIGGIDLTYKWVPAGRAKYRTFTWRNEILFSKRNTETDPIKSWGFYSSLQWKLNAQFWISGRVDYSQLPWNNNNEEKGAALCLDFWQSEFVFIRFQYSFINRNFEDNDRKLVFQTCWAMGPHKHEAY